MTFNAKLGFKNPSSSQDLNETQAKIIDKGIYDGGALGLSGVSLNITIAPFVAVGYDGMVVVSDATETVTVIDGQINYIVLLSKYEYRAAPTIQFQVLDDVSWAASIHSDYFINWARVDLSAGGFSGVTAAEVYYNESDWSEKVGGGNWKTSVATTGDLPTLYNKNGDTRMVISGYKPYTWRSATQTWEAAFDSEASLVNYGGGSNWHDGTTNPATTVEAQLDKIITDLILETGGGGADKLGCGARSNWLDTTTNPVGSIFDALEKIITDLNATTGSAKIGCAARSGWHDGTTNPTSSNYDALEKVITDLVNAAGSDRVGSAAITDSPYSLSTGSIKDQFVELLDHINSNATNVAWAYNYNSYDVSSGFSGAYKGVATDGTITCFVSNDSYLLVYTYDGITYHEADISTYFSPYPPKDIAYYNGYWVIVSDDGAFTASDPLSTWTAVASLSGENLNCVDGGNGYWVAGDNGGYAWYVAGAPTGTWVTNSVSVTTPRDVHYSAVDDTWAICGLGGDISYIVGAPSGTWTPSVVGSSTYYGIMSTTINGSVRWFMAGTSENLQTAAHPSTGWSTVTLPTLGGTPSLRGLAAGNDAILVGCAGGSDGEGLLISKDGVNFYIVPIEVAVVQRIIYAQNRFQLSADSQIWSSHSHGIIL